MDGIMGKAVAITGGAGDIGAAMGAELAGHGAEVTLIDRKPDDEAAPWIDRVRARGTVRYVRADVTDGELIRSVIDDLPRLDIAIGNAGIVESSPFLDIDERSWRRHLDVNLTGCFLLGQAAARRFVSEGRPGRILFTGSWVQDVPWPEITAYSSSKAGLKMLARSMARELAPHRILVNVIAPGIVDAGLARHQRETEPAYARRVAKVIPLGDLQTADQVARVTAFLCSDAADYLTGSVLLADGGASLFQFDRD